MSLINWKKNALFPSSDSLWGDLLNDDFFNKGIKLGTTMPAVNVKETDTSYNLDVAVPGMKKEDIKIKIEHGVLSIAHASSTENEQVDKEKITRKEYSYSSFERSFTLPENADEENVTASYNDGILKIEIAKVSQAKAAPKKMITIK